MFAAATGPFVLFYTRAARRRSRPWGRVSVGVLQTLALGIGLSAPVSRAVLRGLRRGTSDPFLRTPKLGAVERSAYVAERSVGLETAAVLLLGGVMVVYAALAASLGFWASLPFIVLFGSGYLGLGLTSLADHSFAASEAESVAEEDREHRRPYQRAHPEGLRPDAAFLVGSEAPVP